MGRCFVYIIRSGSGFSAPVKIGVSDVPENRIKELQTGNPYRLFLIAKLPFSSRADAFEVEKYLHNQLTLTKLCGEWFKMDKARNIPQVLSKFVAGAQYENLNPTGSKQIDRIRSLERENKSLKSEVEKLKQDIEDYLDQDFLGI